MHALPLALAGVDRPPGTIVAFIAADSDNEAAWYLTRTQHEWELGRAAPAEATCRAHRLGPGAGGRDRRSLRFVV
ncbi:MAG: hypothetical protein ACTHPS_13270, partial [Streptosporangiaceae bacterium]